MEMTQYDKQLLGAKQCGQNYMWVPRQEPDSRNKTSRSHYKILSKLTEILLEMTQYDQQLLCVKQCGQNYTWVPRQEPDPRNKTSRSYYKILSKLTEICWR